MRWFKHLTRAHSDESITPILDAYGPEAYGVYWLLCEIIGEAVDKTNRCTVVHPASVWKRKLFTTSKKLSSFLQVFKQNRLVSYNFQDENIQISIPKLLKYRDEWTARSGVTPEKLPPKESESESDTELDTKTSEQSASDDAQAGRSESVFELTPASPKKTVSKAERERWFAEEFWPIVWLKIGKDAAKASFLRKILTVEAKDRAIAAAKIQGPGILERGSRPGSSPLHPSTWLNQGRYDDEVTPAGEFRHFTQKPNGTNGHQKQRSLAEDHPPEGRTPAEYDAMYGTGWWEQVGKHIGLKARSN